VTAALAIEGIHADWTDVNHLRHSKFIALRDDKPAKDVRREQAVG